MRAAGFLAALLLPRIASAQEFELRAADLRVIGDTRWTGGGWGGYHPIRLEIANFGPGRDLELRFEPHERGEGVPTVRRRVRVEQNATARLTLSIPLVGGTSGRLEFLVGGAPVEGLRRDLSLMPRDNGGSPTPSLLAISPDAVDWTGFQHAVLVAAQEASGSGVPSTHVLRGGMPAGGDTRYAAIGPSLLPSTWVDYSAVDLVAVRLDVLAAMRPDERAALLDWTAAGGRLIVHRVGAELSKSEELERLLGASADGEAWHPAELIRRRSSLPMAFATGNGSPTPNEGDPLPEAIKRFIPPGVPSEEIQRRISLLHRLGGNVEGIDPAVPSWPGTAEAFAVRPVGFGYVAAVSGDAFGGTGADWDWLLRSLYGLGAVWPIRNGLTSGGGDIEFIYLPIPGVRGVPAFAFLSLITLFAIAIGPANYFLLWRKRKLSRLVVTVPAVAAVTSVLLFGYAALSHGFGTKGRVRSVTLVDPAANAATSLARVAVFSGLAPSDGLAFSNRTAVYPLLPFGEQFEDGEVDWTEAQGMTAGWLKTRTRTQFVTVNRRDERGRLTVSPVAEGLRVVNGFSVPFSRLVVTSKDGTPYYGRDLAAGGEALFHPLSDEEWAEIREYANDRRPEPPEGVDPNDIKSGFGSRPWMFFQQGWKPQMRFSLLERQLGRLVGEPPRRGVRASAVEDADRVVGEPDRLDDALREDVVDPLSAPRGFLGLVQGNPGIDLGGLDVDERDSVHLLMGTW